MTLPLDIDGVTLPFEIDGVFLPLPTEGRWDGVILPEAEKEGVIRPLRMDATEDGREEIETVAAESFVEATKTPQLGGHMKYCFLENEKCQKSTHILSISWRCAQYNAEIRGG